jgi:hypothetical protein
MKTVAVVCDLPIRHEIDDDRPARDDEVEYCQHCGAAVLEGALQRHLGEQKGNEHGT